MSKAKRTKLPNYLKKYFWDVDFKKMDKHRSKAFIIKRLLEYGDQKAVKFLKKHYRQRDLADMLRNTRDISPKSAIFWSQMLNVSKSEILFYPSGSREPSTQFGGAEYNKIHILKKPYLF